MVQLLNDVSKMFMYMHTSTIFFESCRLSLTQAFGFQEQRVKPMGDDLLTEKGPNRYHDPQVTQQWSSPLHMYIFNCTALSLLYLVSSGTANFLFCIVSRQYLLYITLMFENGYMKFAIFECDFNWNCSNMKNRMMQFLLALFIQWFY